MAPAVVIYHGGGWGVTQSPRYPPEPSVPPPACSTLKRPLSLKATDQCQLLFLHQTPCCPPRATSVPATVHQVAPLQPVNSWPTFGLSAAVSAASAGFIRSCWMCFHWRNNTGLHTAQRSLIPSQASTYQQEVHQKTLFLKICKNHRTNFYKV